MRVILSRKGFDSSNGGIPSAILPNGIMLSFPIPDDVGTVKYSELKIEQFLPRDIASLKNLLDLLKILIKSGNIKQKSQKIDLNGNPCCHLDPDIYNSYIDRLSGWRGIFGQIGAAQSHLRNQGIQEGDLFLFFGWFKETEKINGSLRWKSGDKNGRHIIYGYLQVGKILELFPDMVNIVMGYKTSERDDIKEWMKYHPHLNPDFVKKNRKAKYNTLYIARERLLIDGKEYSKPGWGVFYYSESLVLTKKGETRRSYWQLPSFFKELKVSYHSEKSWQGDIFVSARIGQEFVIQEDRRVVEWAKNLIMKNELVQ